MLKWRVIRLDSSGRFTEKNAQPVRSGLVTRSYDYTSLWSFAHWMWNDGYGSSRDSFL